MFDGMQIPSNVMGFVFFPVVFVLSHKLELNHHKSSAIKLRFLGGLEIYRFKVRFFFTFVFLQPVDSN